MMYGKIHANILCLMFYPLLFFKYIDFIMMTF